MKGTITMIPNDYIHGRLAEAHRRDLLRQAEQEQLATQLPKSTYNFRMLVRLVFPWRVFRISLQKRLHQRMR